MVGKIFGNEGCYKLLQLNYCIMIENVVAYSMINKENIKMNDIVCLTECTNKCGNWDEIDDPDVIAWTCSDCCVMIGINNG